jgi:hypothetical protein
MIMLCQYIDWACNSVEKNNHYEVELVVDSANLISTELNDQL